jgi:transposase
MFAARLELKQALDGMALVEMRLKEVEEAQSKALEQVSYAPLLLGIPGLGIVTVATILGETGDLRDYRDAESVIKFAGYNLYTIASGSFRGRTRITKRGRPLLRQQLYLAACRMSKIGAPLGTFSRRLSDRKAGPVVMVGGCRKLLRLMVAIVRDGRPYEPGRLGVPSNKDAVA